MRMRVGRVQFARAVGDAHAVPKFAREEHIDVVSAVQAKSAKYVKQEVGM